MRYLNREGVGEKGEQRTDTTNQERRGGKYKRRIPPRERKAPKMEEGSIRRRRYLPPAKKKGGCGPFRTAGREKNITDPGSPGGRRHIVHGGFIVPKETDRASGGKVPLQREGQRRHPGGTPFPEMGSRGSTRQKQCNQVLDCSSERASANRLKKERLSSREGPPPFKPGGGIGISEPKPAWRAGSQSPFKSTPRGGQEPSFRSASKRRGSRGHERRQKDHLSADLCGFGGRKGGRRDLADRSPEGLGRRRRTDQEIQVDLRGNRGDSSRGTRKKLGPGPVGTEKRIGDSYLQAPGKGH